MSAYRERVIRHILGTNAGIYGAEVCQMCGEIRTFRHLWIAQFTHSGPDFLCTGCIRTFKPDPNEIGTSFTVARDAFKELRKRRSRMCELCRSTIEDADRDRHAYGPSVPKWVCPPCSERVLSEHGSEWPHDLLRDLSRRRFLEIRCPTDDELRGWGRMVAEMRFDLDEGWAGSPKPGLVGTREERWREMVREVGEVHGVNYLSDAD